MKRIITIQVPRNIVLYLATSAVIPIHCVNTCASVQTRIHRPIVNVDFAVFALKPKSTSTGIPIQHCVSTYASIQTRFRSAVVNICAASVRIICIVASIGATTWTVFIAKNARANIIVTKGVFSAQVVRVCITEALTHVRASNIVSVAVLVLAKVGTDVLAPTAGIHVITVAFVSAFGIRRHRESLVHDTAFGSTVEMADFFLLRFTSKVPP
jgi:hypothetical protein